MTLPETTSSFEFNKQLPPPPRVSGLPLLGNALDFLNRPIEFFLECYHKFGPIFHITAANQKFVVLAGLEANRFMAQDKDEIFTSESLFGEFAQKMGSTKNLVALDGAPHRHMRKVLQRGFSKSAIAPKLDDILRLTTDVAHGWRPDSLIFVRDQFQSRSRSDICKRIDSLLTRIFP